MAALKQGTGEIVEQKPYTDWKSLYLDTDRGIFIKVEEDGNLSCKAIGSADAVPKLPFGSQRYKPEC
jgi:hypothetical protein